MIRLIVGTKGTGKTKTLIGLVNDALASSKGSVVCIEKGDKLRYDINYRCRLIDSEAYCISDGGSLYGFIAGMLASNHDITDLFIDSALKICRDDIKDFDIFLERLGNLNKEIDVNIVITSSIDPSAATAKMKEYIK
ncbi:MAG: hypothetical protein IJU57_03545 [Clostridia bacterium]|nr:hypothetical protein [Clostridia bacterium]